MSLEEDLLDWDDEPISFSLLSRWEETGKTVAPVDSLLVYFLSNGYSLVFLSERWSLTRVKAEACFSCEGLSFWVRDFLSRLCGGFRVKSVDCCFAFTALT